MPATFEGSLAYTPPPGGVVVTIGNFDGVHLGHQALLSKARERAGNGLVTALTFFPDPREVLRPDRVVPKLQTLSERAEQLGVLGADHVVVEPFDRELSERDPRWFAGEILEKRLRARAVVVGWDFRFGRGRAGTPADLADWLGVPVDHLPQVQVGGAGVSSSRIREALARGAVDEAAACLGRPPSLGGHIVRGDGRGRTIGFPTANVALPAVALPANGVYAVRAALPGGSYDGVANLGVRPTIGASTEPRLEVHLFDFSGDLYDQPIRVSFHARIREERRFLGLPALVEQIRLDAGAARSLLAGIA